jgi:hypothetical protein
VQCLGSQRLVLRQEIDNLLNVQLVEWLFEIAQQGCDYHGNAGHLFDLAKMREEEFFGSSGRHRFTASQSAAPFLRKRWLKENGRAGNHR